MTDDKRKLPDIPAEAAERIIEAAATISGKPPGDLNLEQAAGILLNTDPETIREEILHRAAEVGAAVIFSDDTTGAEAASLDAAAQQILDAIDYLKEIDRQQPFLMLALRKQVEKTAAALFDDPEQAAQWAAAIHEKAAAEATAQTVAETIERGIEPVIKKNLQQLRDALDIVAKGKKPAQCTKKQQQTMKEAAAFITGQEADTLKPQEAADIIRGVLDSMSREKLNELLQQEGLKPIRPAEDQQREAAEPVKENPAADAPGDDPDDGRRVIRVDLPEYDPTLDPDSPDFDPEKWKACTAAASERLKETVARTQETIAEAMQPALTSAALKGMIEPAGAKLAEALTKPMQDAARHAISPAITEAMQSIAERNKILTEAMRSPAIEAIQEMTRQTQEVLKGLSKTIAPTFTAMHNYFNSDAWQSLRETLAEIAQAAPAWLEIAEEITELTPYLEAELQKPEYEGKSIDELFDAAETDDDGNPIEKSLFMQALTAARAARDADAERKQLPQVSYNNGTDVKTVTDKFANLFFSLSAPQSRGMINGQRQFIPVRYEQLGAKKEITLLYDYSFNEDIIKRFGLSRNFDDQAFFVASIIDNLLDEGNSTVSLTKVWHELGNSGSPSAEALTNLVNILRLGMSTIITADISQVNEAWGIEKDGKTRELISPVIPVQIAQEKFAANGKTANAVINITGHTPFYIIGYPLDHFTTWNKDVLRLYKGRRTKRYYSVLRFLITQIGWMRNGKSKRSNKILYESLCTYTGDKSTRARQLSRDMMYRLFDEVFIPTGYISAYKEDTSGKPGVKLTYTQQPKITKKK